MIPAVQILPEERQDEAMPGQKRGFVRLYHDYLIAYINAIESELAAIRQRMNEVAQSGRIPYPFADIVERERVEKRGDDPRNFAQIGTAALLLMERDLTSITSWEAVVKVYEDMPKADWRDDSSLKGVMRVQLHEDTFPVIDRIASFMESNDIRLKGWVRGGGTQIVLNLAIIYAGRQLMGS